MTIVEITGGMLRAARTGGHAKGSAGLFSTDGRMSSCVITVHES
jgi:hypothetical protein